MKTFENFDEYRENKNLFLSIGFFDGLHLGHQQVLKILVQNARSNNCPSAVVTFSFHPFKTLGSSSQPLAILPLKQRLNYIEQMGVDYTFILDFSKKIAEMEAKDFIEKIIVEKLKVKKLYVGEDFRFGKNRHGDIKLLRKEGQKFGFSIMPVPLLKVRDDIVSSTKIRKYIKEGNFEKTEQLLGRKYSLLGRVTEGKGISKDIQYPTANMYFDETLLPPESIYAGWAKTDGKTYKSAFFVATEPKRLIEAHVIDLKENIYHKEVEIIFFKKIRSRVVFKTRQDAQTQIAKDVERVEEILD